MTLQSQLQQSAVGAIVELFDIDLSPIGVNSQYYLTSSATSTINWQGRSYQAFPIVCSNVDRSMDQAPGRVTLTVAAAQNQTISLIGSILQQYGDLVGANVTRWRTLATFLDAGATPDPNQYFPIQRYTIIQKAVFNPTQIQFICATKLDRPGLFLPRRQILKDKVDNDYSLYCPGVSRAGVRLS